MSSLLSHWSPWRSTADGDQQQQPQQLQGEAEEHRRTEEEQKKKEQEEEEGYHVAKERAYRKEVRRLRAEVKRLQNTQYQQAQAIAAKEASLTLSQVSQEKVSAFVAGVLADKEQNVWAIPDAIEGPLYESAIKVAVGAIAHVLESTRVELLGHEVRFVLKPLESNGDHLITTSDAEPPLRGERGFSPPPANSSLKQGKHVVRRKRPRKIKKKKKDREVK